MLTLKNILRAIKPPTPHPSCVDTFSLAHKTLLLHTVGVADLGVHTENSLRIALSPLVGSTLITFDDGYKHTLNLIKQLAADGHKILLFLCGMMHEGEYLPKDKIQIIVKSLRQGDILKIGPIKQKLLSNNGRYKYWLAYKINRLLMTITTPNEYVRYIEDAVANYASNMCASSRYELMNRADVADLLDLFPSIEIGIHGWSHYRLDLLKSSTEYYNEITSTRDLFESIWCTRVNRIAPPYGMTNPKLNTILSSEGYQIHLLNNIEDGRGSTDPTFRISIDWTYLN